MVVAVVDSGVDWRHPLLNGRMWVNPGESQDGRDRDGNGYVDDIVGWNFLDDSPYVFVDPQEDEHGTHVAGIIAGERHRESGFVGVAPGARIMSLKVVGEHQGRLTSTDSMVIAALRYAQDNGADVINMSMGTPQGSVAVRTAVAELGIPLVAAAGNFGEERGSPVGYPAAFELPNLVAVAALDHRGMMAYFSSRDRRTVDVAAPGVFIPSTVPAELGYLAIHDGTSMAAPHVAGVLALALERHPDLHRAVHGRHPRRCPPRRHRLHAQPPGHQRHLRDHLRVGGPADPRADRDAGRQRAGADG